MNNVEKGKSSFKKLGLALIIVGLLSLIGGVVLAVIATSSSITKIAILVVGVLLVVLSIAGITLGIYVAKNSKRYTQISENHDEENLVLEMAYVNKCENCEEDVKDGEKLCVKCKETSVE